MPAFLAFVPAWAWRWIAIAGVGLACMAVGAFKMHAHDQIAYDELATEYAVYKGRIVELGKEARDKADATKKEQDKTTKEIEDAAQEDVDTIHAYYAAHPRVVRVRSSGGPVPAAPDCPARTDGAASEPATPRPDQPGISEEACALDAARINRWRDFATKNHLPVD